MINDPSKDDGASDADQPTASQPDAVQSGAAFAGASSPETSAASGKVAPGMETFGDDPDEAPTEIAPPVDAALDTAKAETPDAASAADGANEASEESDGDDSDEDEIETGPAEPDEGEADRIRALFTRSVEASDEEADVGDADASDAADGDAPTGAFHFARWSRPIAPRLFGVEPQSVEPIMAGVAEAAKRAGVEIVEEDPEFGVNLLIFVCEEWAELKSAPGMDRLVPDIAKLANVLAATGANQYRIFSFSPQGGIRLAVVLLRYDDDMARFSPKALGLGQMTQSLLLWSDTAFTDETPLALNRRGDSRLKPWFSDLLGAAYDPETPDYSDDPSLAEQLAVGVATRRAAARKSAAGSKRRGGGRRNGASRGGETESARAAEPDADVETTEAAPGADASLAVDASTVDATTADAPASDAPASDAPADDPVQSGGGAPMSEASNEVASSEPSAADAPAGDVAPSSDHDPLRP